MLTGGRRDVMEDWFADRNTHADVGDEIRTILQYLRFLPRIQWNFPEFRQLSRPHRELGEVRTKVGGVQYRAIGFFGPGTSEFTLIIGAKHKGKRYYPQDALDTALRRMKMVIERKVNIHDFKLESVDQDEE